MAGSDDSDISVDHEPAAVSEESSEDEEKPAFVSRCKDTIPGISDKTTLGKIYPSSHATFEALEEEVREIIRRNNVNPPRVFDFLAPPVYEIVGPNEYLLCYLTEPRPGEEREIRAAEVGWEKFQTLLTGVYVYAEGTLIPPPPYVENEEFPPDTPSDHQSDDGGDDQGDGGGQGEEEGGNEQKSDVDEEP